ncbi:MAG: hypothetical protein ABFD92_21640 [Planctomycetaceae bacterium]
MTTERQEKIRDACKRVLDKAAERADVQLVQQRRSDAIADVEMMLEALDALKAAGVEIARLKAVLGKLRADAEENSTVTLISFREFDSPRICGPVRWRYHVYHHDNRSASSSAICDTPEAAIMDVQVKGS